jgi:hypothetical protein
VVPPIPTFFCAEELGADWAELGPRSRSLAVDDAAVATFVSANVTGGAIVAPDGVVTASTWLREQSSDDLAYCVSLAGSHIVVFVAVNVPFVLLVIAKSRATETKQRALLWIRCVVVRTVGASITRADGAISDLLEGHTAKSQDGADLGVRRVIDGAEWRAILQYHDLTCDPVVVLVAVAERENLAGTEPMEGTVRFVVPASGDARALLAEHCLDDLDLPLDEVDRALGHDGRGEEEREGKHEQHHDVLHGTPPGVGLGREIVELALR